MKLTSIHMILGIVFHDDLDMKKVFLLGDLEEVIYMQQPLASLYFWGFDAQ